MPAQSAHKFESLNAMPLTPTNEADKVPLPEDIQARRERILVVEDDTDLQRMLTFALTRLGYQVQTSPDGLHALNLLQEAAPEERAELILTDVQMPGLDGIELLRRVRADDPDMPVIVMTAFTSNSAIMHALRLHADDFVAKPIEMAELKTSLDRALRARRQRIALEAERTRAARLQAVLETATAVNHEINNPLAAISVSAQLMRQQLERDGAVRERELDNQSSNTDSANTSAAPQASTQDGVNTGTQPDLAALERLLDVIIEQCDRIADFNRKLTGVVNPVTRSSGGHRMLDVEHSLSDQD
jgi:DNA-binding response OmpR family regulator